MKDDQLSDCAVYLCKECADYADKKIKANKKKTKWYRLNIKVNLQNDEKNCHQHLGR